MESVSRRRSLSALELERASRELTLVQRRLDTREYKQSSFQRENLLSIPDRTEEIFSDLSFFNDVGRIWEKLFRGCDLGKKASLLDVGCGYFPKVELGLYYYGFLGRVTALDVDARALRRAATFLDFFRVKFDFAPLVQSFWERLGWSHEAIVANHLLDDLLLHQFCEQREVPLTELYASEERFIEAWREIVDDRDLQMAFADKLSAHLDRLVGQKGLLMLLDYPSFSHRSLRLFDVVRTIRRVSTQIRENLAKSGFVNIDPMGDAILVSGRLRVPPCDRMIFRRK